MSATHSTPANALWRGAAPLVLASKSPARGMLLESAGLPFETRVADIDERAIEDAARAGGAGPVEVASLLAAEKARTVARSLPGRLVIGADQTLALDEDALHKPADRQAARAQLQRLSGRVHALHSAVAVARDGMVLFEMVQAARLTMRPLDDAVIEAYLDAAGALVLTSVGGYQLEGLGIHLFERVEGDHATILGLPLLALLAFLRREGVLL